MGLYRGYLSLTYLPQKPAIFDEHVPGSYQGNDCPRSWVSPFASPGEET
jgi:hypothetical protein